jgi:hypothetical protein
LLRCTIYISAEHNRGRSPRSIDELLHKSHDMKSHRIAALNRVLRFEESNDA